MADAPKLAAALTLASVAMVGAPSNAQAAQMSLRTLAAEQVRLSAMAYRISTQNAGICPRREVMTGLVLHNLAQYDAAARPAVAQATSLSGGFGILGVVPGSVGAQAGLTIDDEILSVGTHEVTERLAAMAPRKSFKRMAWFHSLLQRELGRGQTTLRVKRAGQERSITLRGQPGCGGDVSVADSPELNAWADGNHIVVTTGMTRMAQSDHEIAFVIAHEMAHNMLGHSAKSNERRGIFGGIKKVRAIESEADSLAVTLTSRAGYDPQGGLVFLDRAKRRLWWAISLTHPGFGTRMRRVAAAIQASELARSPRPLPIAAGPELKQQVAQAAEQQTIRVGGPTSTPSRL